MSVRTYTIVGVPGATFVTDAYGRVTLVPGAAKSEHIDLLENLLAPTITDADAFPVPALIPGAVGFEPLLVTDDEAIFAPDVVREDTGLHLAPDLLLTDADAVFAPSVSLIPILLPALWAADDAIFAPTVASVAGAARTLSAPFVTSADVIYSSFATLVGTGGGPQQKLKPPPKHQDPEIIYAAALSRMPSLVIDVDNIRAPLVTAQVVIAMQFVTDADAIHASEIAFFSGFRPSLWSSDDTIYSVTITQVMLPALMNDDDDIPAADVGWQVIAEFTVDDEVVHDGTNVYAYYELLPEVWADEETIDTYPFFLQQLTGGVPVPDREGVLKGSIKKGVHLKGSIQRRRAA